MHFACHTGIVRWQKRFHLVDDGTASYKTMTLLQPCPQSSALILRPMIHRNHSHSYGFVRQVCAYRPQTLACCSSFFEGAGGASGACSGRRRNRPFVRGISSSLPAPESGGALAETRHRLESRGRRVPKSPALLPPSEARSPRSSCSCYRRTAAIQFSPRPSQRLVRSMIAVFDQRRFSSAPACQKERGPVPALEEERKERGAH